MAAKGGEALVARLRELERLGTDAPAIAAAGVRKSLSGYRVSGHVIRMKGMRLRITGPKAPAVARSVALRARAGAAAALKASLR